MGLEQVWFVLIAVLWSGYFLLEGFDFGVGMLLPVLGRDNTDRRVLINTIGPVWDGNEVWLVVAGGATFAAFPAWYATMFSGFYLALLLILFFLIVRVVSFEWRDKSESPRWRRAWMWANAGGSAGIALVWGIAFANLIQGVALDSKHDYTGNLADLFTGYTVFAGLALVIVFAFHGANFLTLRTAGDLCERAQRAAAALAVPAVAAGAAFLIWTVVVAVDHNDKGVFPPIVPAVIGIAALVVAAGFVYLERSGVAFTLTALGIVSTVATLFTSLYPRVMVSDPNFGNSLTVSNAASAHYTLVVLTVVAAIVTPLVLLYQGWTYYVFRARVTGEEVESPDALIGAPSGSRAR